MRNLSDTVARLAKFRGQQFPAAPVPDRLGDLQGFGENPGGLRARTYIPHDLPEGAPLVVVLHGCTQTAAGYDHGSGWSRLADRHKFALLYPEQQRTNNPNLCFNWFQPEDIRRESGEALSIRRMIDAVATRHDINPDRVYITGLSAGGAMTSVMLATYPDVFASGAIIAGLPYGTAATVPEAFDRMRGHGGPAVHELPSLVRGASGHDGEWPTVSIWHGSGDHTVVPSNAEASLAQWRALHDVSHAPTYTAIVDGHPRRVWCDDRGREVIEEFSIAGMGHGTPLSTAIGIGESGPYMLDVNISSTVHIARFWGIVEAADVRDGYVAAAEAPRSPPRRAAPTAVPQLPRLQPPPASFGQGEGPGPASSHGASGVGKIIEDALRKAGLMR